ncbi:DmsC/YnfH family molybdoenzyme membrane anchor subunit [Rubinisphaera sp.]|uniref:DmsC/YnfH family molybdoenzyme membrane anchor subunit n=1 Tax=Rubinisphaera sp. TaxID=2024857 RepID=UPI000C0FB687|nr:DmsC/YnfH family molybdoenzyme membrane anchor subunit [Rubinisphaera sp.]MBV10725.1 molybdopterin oxidoreductase [Rubinisphaera sp.]|tara:strand:+ start:14001 stop:15695 length:1695 start_codon:yes stop_codon:yes gene_type:complete
MNSSTAYPDEEQIGAHSDLLGLLLREQQEMSAVERFSLLHDNSIGSCQVQQYHTLLPTIPLEAGEQYGFSVDLDRCSGCKACVTACHNLNGLDEDEAWRDVGLLYSDSAKTPLMQHVTSACHHCIDPACMKACPTNSYEKDKVTGIVRHLDDQCFGCQYCTLACPYGVPKYHEKKGIVRKCDMCTQRLSVNEAPACVQACPHEAISITKVNIDEAKAKALKREFITGAHDPSYTIPTTIYHSKKPLSEELLRGDQHQLTPEHAHLPLVIMLVLIQVSTGAFLFLQLCQLLFDPAIMNTLMPYLTLATFGVSQAALGASTMHLGRPLYAFRGILGFTHSWMSREIVAFGLYSAAAGAFFSSFWIPAGWMPMQSVIQNYGGWAAVLTGYTGIGCSIMIYQCTQRSFWNGSYTTMKFMLTTLVGGIAFLMIITPIIARLFGDDKAWELAATGMVRLSGLLMVAVIAKLIAEGWVFRHLQYEEDSSLKTSAELLVEPLRYVLGTRMAFALLSMALAFVIVGQENTLAPTAIAVLAALSGISALLGELTERYLFFSAVVAPKMPGGLRS